MKNFTRLGLLVVVILLMALGVSGAAAATTCTFTTVGTTMTLDADCTTDATIPIPGGVTLDGGGYTITAVDPSVDHFHFHGAVVANAGTTAYVKNLNVTASGLVNACHGGADRLRGIMFEGASGSIMHSTVMDLNRGASGCQEGNAIEVRNAPFDGTHLGTVVVEIAHNKLDDYQKSGIVANGDVDVNIHHNHVGASATQANLAANAVQLGFGAIGVVKHNLIDGNQWLGASDFAATAVLVFLADSFDVSQNNIGGNADVGIFIIGDDGTVNNNIVFDNGTDGPHGDFGIADLGTGNAVTNNKVRGYDTPYFGVTDGRNKVIPGPQDFS